MGRNLRRVVAPAVCVVLAGLGGCSLAGGASSSAGDASVSAGPGRTATAPAPSPSPGPSSPRPAGPAPAGTTWVHAEGSSVRFVVPTGWTVLPMAEALDRGDPEALAALAKRMNVPVSQVKAAARAVDLAVFGPEHAGFAPNVTVQRLPLAEVPGEAQLRMILGIVGARVDSVEDVTTPLGAGRLSRYGLEVGSTKAVGRLLAVAGPEGVVLVTATALDRAQAEVVVALVRSSIAAD